MGTEPTHRRVTVNVIDIARIVHGRIVEHWGVWLRLVEHPEVLCPMSHRGRGPRVCCQLSGASFSPTELPPVWVHWARGRAAGVQKYWQ